MSLRAAVNNSRAFKAKCGKDESTKGHSVQLGGGGSRGLKEGSSRE